MKSTDLVELLKMNITKEVSERVEEHLISRMDDLLGKRMAVNCEYLSIEKSCEYLGVGRSTFYSLVKKHKPLKIILGTSPRYAKSDLDKMFKLKS